MKTEVEGFKFQWDDKKAKINISKHGVSFLDAAWVWQDEYRMDFVDDEHSFDEERYITIGKANDILFVVYTERDDEYNIRLISARPAEDDERRDYDEYRSLLSGKRC
ncbi:MAG: BrnT family toxin [Selenomonadaceae bacterium]|nr:BrnT family toxin [Selenomonadaceae bacterium]